MAGPSNPAAALTDEETFRRGVLRSDHRLVDPCFMTGKGCVYTQVIEDSRRQRRTKNLCAGFFILPFRENYEVFHRNCLDPFLKDFYSATDTSDLPNPLPDTISLDTADTARRPGAVICEGICKRIQESHFIIADISTPNPNVFYELGLAFGLGHQIVPIHQLGSSFGEDIAKHLGSMPYVYTGLDPLKKEAFKLHRHLWMAEAIQHAGSTATGGNEPGTILFELALREHPALRTWETYQPTDSDEAAGRRNDPLAALNEKLQDLLYGAAHVGVARNEDGDLKLSFRTHLKSAFGLSIPRILHPEKPSDEETVSLKRIDTYHNTIERIGSVYEIGPLESFKEIRSRIERVYCTVIRTGFPACHPMAYFWLGYGHARGKNVIPVTVVREPREPIDDLAFDIRAQRHMTFVKRAPKRLEEELRQTLKHLVLSDFAIWSRKHFWDETLGRRGEVWIFTGAITHPGFRREVIGDWDLRAASELTSYLTRHEYRASIASPVYTPEGAQVQNDQNRNDYILQLGKLLHGKNCIIIASPEVNPLTEIVLGHLYGIDQSSFFKGPVDSRSLPRAIIAIKETSNTTKKVESTRALYTERTVPASEQKSRRGFRSSRIQGHDGEILQGFVNQRDPPEDFSVYAHLAVLPNLFAADGSFQQDRSPQEHEAHIIVLNGLSGPATFALTHVLTGGVSEEFAAYDREAFDPAQRSEVEVEKILALLERARNDRNAGGAVERIYNVAVKRQDSPPSVPSTKDWRQIHRWSVDGSLTS